jgi:UV DNA damage repair endonuclease
MKHLIKSEKFMDNIKQARKWLSFMTKIHDKDTMRLSSPNMTDDYRYVLTLIIKVNNK